MKFLRLIQFSILILAAASIVSAQNAGESPTAPKDEKDKAKLELEGKAFALAERVASDATTLKLAENRAFVLAMSGDLLWKQDQKRARRLFRQAGEELMAANAEAEKEEAGDPLQMFSVFNSPRRTILQTVAKHDPDLALELLVQTRPTKLAAELARAAVAQPIPPASAEPETPAAMMRGQNMKFQVQQELQIEQSFAAQAAANNPQKAAKLIRESLTKGVSFEAVASVRKLHAKDAELGNQMLSETMQKLLASDFSKQESQERNVALQVLRQFGQPSTAAVAKDADAKKDPLKVEDKTLRELGGKIADYLMKTTNFTALWEFSSALPLLEKLLPDRIAALKQKQASLKKSAPEGMQMFDGFNTLNDPNAAPEKVIADAATIPGQMRGMMYRRAAEKLIEKGEATRAKQLLSEAPAGKERDDALAYVDGKLAEKAAKDGKFNEARKMIAGIGTKAQQIEQLVKLALVFYAKKDKEGQETAVKIMDEARTLVDTTPQNEEEIQNLVQVVAGYAVIDSPRAFGMLEPLVDQMNELMQAAALIAKYQKPQQFQQSPFRDGELLLNTGIGQMRGQMSFVKELGLLAAADFERTRNLSDKFTRADVQILIRLLIAQSVLQDHTRLYEGTGGGFGGSTMISVSN